MNTLEALTQTLTTKPDDTCRLALSDWLWEFGTEEDWQGLLDRFPADHLLRERFGCWLEERGDERGKVYRLLAETETTPDTEFFITHCYTLNPQWSLRCDPSALPSDWFQLADDPDDENSPLRFGRRMGEEAVIRAFLKLPTDRQQELLRGRR